jgi:hypothetical protein
VLHAGRHVEALAGDLDALLVTDDDAELAREHFEALALDRVVMERGLLPAAAPGGLHLEHVVLDAVDGDRLAGDWVVEWRVTCGAPIVRDMTDCQGLD